MQEKCGQIKFSAKKIFCPGIDVLDGYLCRFPFLLCTLVICREGESPNVDIGMYGCSQSGKDIYPQKRSNVRTFVRFLDVLTQVTMAIDAA